jgi:hypothetical protein
MFRNLKLFNEWYASLNDEQRRLFGQYVQIRRAEGANWVDILKELIAHLPDILSFITAVVNLFHHPMVAAVFAFALFTAGAFGQGSPPPAKIANPPAAKVALCCDCCTCAEGKCRCAWPGECLYRDAYRLSLLDHKPLIVFVGQPGREVPGCRVCEVPAFPGAKSPGMVIGIPDGVGTMDRIDVVGRAEVAAIREKVKRAGCEFGFCPKR